MKTKTKIFTSPDSYGKANTWIQKYKSKSNVIVLSSGIGDENHGRRIAYVYYDKNMTDREAREIRNRRQK